MIASETWSLQLDPDAVLRAQGADPARMRARGSAALTVAASALDEGLALLEPAVVQERLPVIAFRHSRLLVGPDGSGRLSGALVRRHLHSAREIAVVVCTIGPALDERASSLMRTDPARSVALDAVGSVAVEQLATLVSSQVEQEAAGEGLCTTIPLSPGLIGWTLETGQPQLFALVDTAAIGVTLGPGSMMAPRKSRSLVIGIGSHVLREGDVCDYCAMRARCRYRTAA